jgi:hypothetical protein
MVRAGMALAFTRYGRATMCRTRLRPRLQGLASISMDAPAALLNSRGNTQEDQTSKKSDACRTLGSLMPTRVTLSLASNAILVLPPPSAVIVMSAMLWKP